MSCLVTFRAHPFSFLCLRSMGETLAGGFPKWFIGKIAPRHGSVFSAILKGSNTRDEILVLRAGKGDTTTQGLLLTGRVKTNGLKSKFCENAKAET